jgi:hypothetical protein
MFVGDDILPSQTGRVKKNGSMLKGMMKLE